MFSGIGLGAGGTLMVHSSYKAFGCFDGGPDAVIDSLLDVADTVLFPTFNFQSWTESHYFDIRETLSGMGIISELARRRPGAIRTPHPIFSFAVFGDRKKDFAGCDDKEAFGKNSVFGRFHQLDGLVLCIGRRAFTIHHYVECMTGCDYRRQKEFSGIYVDYHGVPRLDTYSMFARLSMRRIKTDLTTGQLDLVKSGVIKTKTVAGAVVHYTRAADYFDAAAESVRNTPEKWHKVLH